ncbi:MAG TPA: RdgB/HAM1 family non-canonical purine NTP pyrophosphatase [Terriglobales bacterium]|nr:RdgB/HAM1 family non-canonical purine NTP pyrophosphatase [Terriglobales bacterium]
MLPRKVFIATSNPGKLRDFAGAMAGVKAPRLELLPGFSSLPAVEEDGLTFAANAAKKAAFYSAYANSAIVLADDSGLEVASLNGAPGVRSARYAADDFLEFKNTYTALSPDEANNQRLLRELAEVPPEKRAGCFVCALAAAHNGNVLRIFEGEVCGSILSAPQGRHGFGYDPLFYIPALGKTTAELTPEEKAKVSHRGQAFRKFLEWYKQRQ